MLELKRPSHKIQGQVEISGSKSLSNRLLILDKTAACRINIKNLSDSEDTLLLQKAIRAIDQTNKATIDVRHAGTDMRFLTALLSITEGEWIITGSERMKQRPIAELVTALNELGADIKYLEQKGFPPLKITGKKIAGGPVRIDPSISSQFLSALLLLSPQFSNGLVLELTSRIISRPYLDMTLDLLTQCGMEVLFSENRIEVKKKPDPVLVIDWAVESDWSSASYYYGICALSEKAEIRLNHFYEKSLQADAVLPEIYSKLGVITKREDGHSLVLKKQKTGLKLFEYNFIDCPDIAQTVAVTCFALNINARLTGLQTLKHKETDRIYALKTELKKLGAKVEAGDSELILSPSPIDFKQLPIIETYHDHRMAMSFAPLSLLFERVRFVDHQVVTKSYPAFWDDLVSLGFNVNLQP